MKLKRLRRMIVLLLLSCLMACQVTVLGISNQPTEPIGMTAQPLEANSDAPAAEPTSAVSQATLTGGMVPESWQFFYNGPQGYSLGYPSVWAVSEELKYSRVFAEIQKEPAGMGPPVRLYVSVFPKEYSDQEGEVYNFITSESIGAFMALPVGASRLKELDAMPPDCFLYTRLPDRKFAGRTALVIENSKVWEAPIGTKDRMVILVTEESTYILGINYETPQQLAMFEQVLDSFQLFSFVSSHTLQSALPVTEAPTLQPLPE